MDILPLLLDTLLLPVAGLCVVYFFRFLSSQQKGERLTLKWRDMDTVRKTVIGAIFLWIFLNFYLGLGNYLSLLNVAVLPFSWIYTSIRPATMIGLAGTLVGLAVIFQLRFPRRPVVA